MGYDAIDVTLTYTDRAIIRAALVRLLMSGGAWPPSQTRNTLNKLR